MNFQTISQTLIVWLAAFGLKILGAIALWVITVSNPAFFERQDGHSIAAAH